MIHPSVRIFFKTILLVLSNKWLFYSNSLLKKHHICSLILLLFIHISGAVSDLDHKQALINPEILFFFLFYSVLWQKTVNKYSGMFFRAQIENFWSWISIENTCGSYFHLRMVWSISISKDHAQHYLVKIDNAILN
ncbi:hypothetical protein ACJX0J_025258, partial [Zea mays]